MSTLYSYGGYREDNGGLRGASLVLEGNRIVFADPLRGGSVLSLVKVTNDGRLQLLDQVTTNRSLTTVGVSTWLWFSVPNFDLLALGQDRFALAGDGPDYGASLYDIVGERIVERAEYLERLSNGVKACTVSAGDRLWRLSQSSLQELLVSPDGNITSGKSVGGAHAVATALAPDRKLLYVARTGGIGRYDLSTEPPQWLEQLWTGHVFAAVGVNDQYLVTQEVESKAGGGRLAALSVYRVGDQSLVATFKADDTNQPIGFALFEDGLLIEWDVVDGPTRRLVNRLYQLTGSEPLVLSEHLVWEDCCNSKPRFDPVRVSVRGPIAVLSPWQQVLRLEAGGTTQRMVTGAGHGGLTQVQSLGAGFATGFDNYSSQLIDLSNPKAPRFVEGGLFDPRLTHPVQLVESARGAGLRLLSSSANSVMGTGPFSNSLSVLHAKTGERALPNGDVTLDGEAGYLFAQGSDLYQLTAVGNTAYRLRRREATDTDGSRLSRVLSDQVVTVAGADAAAPSKSVAAADPFSRLIVIADLRGPAATSQLTLHWLEEGERGFALRASWSVALDGHILLALAVARNRAAVLTSKGLTILQLQGNTVTVTAEKQAEPPDTRSDFQPAGLLHFDGTQVLLTGYFEKRTKTIGAYDADTLAWLGGYAPRNHQYEATATEVDSRWLVGSDTGVDLLEPECSAK